jgi:hypothetical protein
MRASSAAAGHLADADRRHPGRSPARSLHRARAQQPDLTATTYRAANVKKRAAARAAKPPATGNGRNGEAAAITPQAFWQHAEKLEPQAPWCAVTREFGVKEPIAQQAYRSTSLPPRVGPMAATKFLTLQPG